MSGGFVHNKLIGFAYLGTLGSAGRGLRLNRLDCVLRDEDGSFYFHCVAISDMMWGLACLFAVFHSINFELSSIHGRLCSNVRIDIWIVPLAI